MPQLKVFNTATKKLEEFETFTPGVVRMYVCGPTVYDRSHLGHARTYIAFDAIKRYLSLRGYHVIHVQNITDIDDKIIKKAQDTGRNWSDVAEENIRSYLEVLKKLGIRPTLSPRVTYHISEIIAAIEKLIELGFAYESNGSVYFDVSKYDRYGELSGRRSAESWRQEEDVLREKRNPFDFALWKRMKEGEPHWSSPWGEGRPGWHIECSVMSSRYLGVPIDIHGGGGDLIFPHHENEKAQSEALFGIKPWVRYWMHTGMLTIRGEKMSKSLGNMVYIDEVLDRWSPEVIRIWVLSSHYRSQLEFNEDSLKQHESSQLRLSTAYRELKSILEEAQQDFRLSEEDVKVLREIETLHREFHEAMSEDFNTAEALKSVRRATDIYFSKIRERETHAPALQLFSFLEEANYIFGFVKPEEARVGEDARLREMIELLIEVRKRLRERGIYDLADKIRSSLGEMGVELQDSGLETRYILRK
ncbi:MAG: cysteine--tRNA ligase [Fervidicoccaceae archaeon]|jgi:cysteinyl-tRNA synthetase